MRSGRRRDALTLRVNPVEPVEGIQHGMEGITMTNGRLGLGLAILAIVSIPAIGWAQQKPEVQILPSPVLPGTLVPRTSQPAPSPELQSQPEKQEAIPANAAEANQPPNPDAPQDKKDTAPTAGRIREPGERFQRPEGEPGYPEVAFGNGHWCWSGWKYGPRIAPSWEYPGLGGGPKITYPWGMPGYTGCNGEKSLDKSHRLWGPPVPVYTPVPQPDDPKKLIYPGRNISSPGFVYGWVGPFSASPRYRHYAVDVWAQPNVDLSTGRPPAQKDKEVMKPGGVGESNAPTGDVEPKKAVSYMTLAVKVPQPGAEVYVDGVKTTQTGTDRTFLSPDLEPGKGFQYEVTVRWVERGSTFEKKTIVIGSSGEVISMDFTTPEVLRAGK
jgi:uncharacterized protein (TIGR03000 family)